MNAHPESEAEAKSLTIGKPVLDPSTSSPSSHPLLRKCFGARSARIDMEHFIIFAILFQDEIPFGLPKFQFLNSVKFINNLHKY
jgi:hypothetical protein